MKKITSLALVAMLAFASAVRAEEKAPAAAAPVADAAAPEAEAKAAPVAKNDNPGSLAGGKELLGAEKYAEAVAYFQGIGVQTAKKREGWRLANLSSALVGAGSYAEAITAAQQAIDIKLSDVQSIAWNNLAAAQARSGKRNDAIATYGKGIEALKAAKLDSAKLEANLAELQNAAEMSKPKKQREAEAKAKAEADKAAEKAAADKAATEKPVTEKAEEKAAPASK